MPAEPTNTVATFGCETVADRLSTVAAGAPDLDAHELRHVESCLRCQAELVKYRRILRSLRALRTERLEPAPGLLTDVLASLEHAGERQAIRAVLHGRRGAYLGGIAAAATAGAAGAFVLAARSRKLKLAS